VANIKARRKLSDLYKKGVEVRFGPNDAGKVEGNVGPFVDSEGKPVPATDEHVAMWVQPPSPLQREMALRDAQAARARALVRAKRNEDSEEHLTVMAFLADMSDDTLIEYVLVSDQDSRRNDATREILALKEWEDITSYQDAMRQFEEMTPEELEDNAEYDALMELDSKFADQVSKREAELLDAAREVLQMRGRGAAEAKALEKRAELVGSQAFMREYERQMMFYSVRDVDDTGVLFFESARELAEQEDEVRELLAEALTPFISDGAEAKNSPGVASGSESSELPKKPETSEASTQPASSE
jgi:hypothetical protein